MTRRYRVHTKADAHRSGLEDLNADFLDQNGIPYAYEDFRIPFQQPAKKRTYTPDFALANGIIIETKGEFSSADRQKHLLVKELHPELEIRFVFSNSRQKLYAGSKTTYAMWAEKHGFKWANRLIPMTWIKEPLFEQSFNKIIELRRLKPHE